MGECDGRRAYRHARYPAGEVGPEPAAQCLDTHRPYLAASKRLAGCFSRGPKCSGQTHPLVFTITLREGEKHGHGAGRYDLLTGYKWVEGGAEVPLEPTGSIGWVIAGAESGTGARPMDEAWVRNIRDACVAVNIPFFYKQDAEQGRKKSLPGLDGKRWTEFPRP